MNIVSDFVKDISNLVENVATSNAVKIAQAISPLFFACLLVYIIYVAWEINYGNKEMFMTDVIKLVGQFTFVGAFCAGSGYYADYVIPFVMHAGQDISAAITGNGDVASNVDNLWSDLTSTLQTFLNVQLSRLGTFDFGGIAVAYTTWAVGYVGGAILVFYSAVFLTLSTFMVGILLSIGTLFICFSVFPSTRGLFARWCGSCLNYILLNVFYTIAFGFVINLIKRQTITDPESATISSSVTLFLVILISVFLIEQIGTLCSTLTGGVGINGLTSATNGIGGKMAGGLAMATGLRAFSSGFGSKMGNPVFNAGRGAADKLQQFATKGSKIKGG